MISAGERLFCDTNILLTAVDKKRPLNAQALHLLNELPNQAELCISGQVVREYLVVSTRPPEANGLGQSLSEALDNVEAVLARATVLEETRDVSRQLLILVRETSSSGKQIHDANVVATMLGHGLRKLVTDNTEDFRRFSAIEFVNLADLNR